MKIKTLFAAILAAGLLFSGCRQDEDYVLPDLRVGTESLEFGQQSNEQTVDVTASREWLVRSKPDWVAIDPDHGPASSAPQRVTLTVLDNAGYDRSGDVVFSIGLSKAAVTVNQKGAKGAKSNGTGKLDDPYTVEGALAAVANLTWTSSTEYQATEVVYVKGIISRIAENGSFAQTGTFGNGNFYISDDGATGDKEFYCYRVLYLGNKKYTSGTDIKVGDEVVICGKLMNYRGNTPETVANEAYLYSLNGETEGGGGGGGNTGTPQGTGTQADPYNAAAANAAASTLTYTDKDNYQKSDNVYIKGKISRIAVDKNNVEQVFTAQFGNASFYISDDGSASNEFYVYRALFLGNAKWQEGNTQIKVGDEVIICGKLMNFNGKTPETVANESYIYSLNGVTEGGGGNGGGGGQTQISYSKVSTITAGGKYILVGIKEGKYYAATPIASDKTYGRLNGKEITVSGDKISTDLSANEFTVSAVDGGYEIAMPDGRKLAVDTEHDGTFQIGDSYSHTFTAELSGDLFKIVHKDTGKTIYHGGGTYTNFSCASSVPADGTLLQLYLKDN